MCDNCRICYEVANRDKYNQLKKQSIGKIKSGLVPMNIVAEDFNPKSLKYGRKVFLLVLAVVFAIMMFFGTIGMIAEMIVDLNDMGYDFTQFDFSTIFSTILFMLAMLQITCAPVLSLIFSIKSFRLAKIKKRVFDWALKNQYIARRGSDD